MEAYSWDKYVHRGPESQPPEAYNLTNPTEDFKLLVDKSNVDTKQVELAKILGGYGLNTLVFAPLILQGLQFHTTEMAKHWACVSTQCADDEIF